MRNAPSFNIGSGNWDIDFVMRGPDLNALAEYGERLRVRSKDLGIIDADTTLKLDSPELRVVIDRQARRRSQRGHREYRHALSG